MFLSEEPAIYMFSYFQTSAHEKIIKVTSCYVLSRAGTAFLALAWLHPLVEETDRDLRVFHGAVRSGVHCHAEKPVGLLREAKIIEPVELQAPSLELLGQIDELAVVGALLKLQPGAVRVGVLALVERSDIEPFSDFSAK